MTWFIFVSLGFTCGVGVIRFVLARALAQHRQLLRETGGAGGLRHVVALSFSPGVTVEGVLLKALPASASSLPIGHSYG